ncbi:MAG: response regulator, partial [Ignavibacterium sp.]
NAVKFTKSGSINLYAARIMTDNNFFAEIKVEDTGIGIPAEKQNLVWQEFRQVSEGFNRSFEGTGLGLTITKKYVELLSGSISLSSEENKGTTFTITLPLNFSASTPLIEKTQKKPEPKFLPKKRTSEKPKILYVEDDVVALQFINIVLKASYNVETAFSAKEALEKITLKKYDALMLDINLGSGMDGLELMQKARENNYYKTIPIVAVTAYAAESDKNEFLSKGFNYYISKPFTQAELHKLLIEIFNDK